MKHCSQHFTEGEIARLREALDAETQRCLKIQKQLDQASAKFEEFVSMAAHDLREPLRDVASFSQLVSETQSGCLDSDARVYLERIQDGAARMQSLLADIVDYWAADDGDRWDSATDMEAVLRQALIYTDRQLRERGAIVTHDPLPQVRGDFDLLTKVLRHLLRNAIAYCNSPVPRIHVSSIRADLEWVVSVADNGPGIDVAFQCRVFEPFRRLHGREHPGNGLGLAFCKKAIESHGGRMWMESTPGTGSTFYFTLTPVG